MKLKISVLIAFVLLAIQFITIDKTNPPVDNYQDFIKITNPPSDIGTMIKNSCYDCHSHKTKYPWYSNVAPVSWIVKNHIDAGRRHLNFSMWNEYNAKKQDHQLDECIEVIENEEMPLISYWIAHSEANLSEEDRQKLIEWFSLIKE